MAPVPFDTQKFVETLTASGLPAAQAKAISSAFRELRAELKSEMLELRNELKADIFALRNDLDKLRDEFKLEMHQLELRMTLKLGAAMVIMIGATAAIVKL
ncbi:MAG: DUF1640 domain-containing protein [Burkholderiaceae bacterium]|nr:DUF1640 domain-containing protein [Burkholderiaceae bacterium]